MAPDLRARLDRALRALAAPHQNPADALQMIGHHHPALREHPLPQGAALPERANNAIFPRVPSRNQPITPEQEPTSFTLVSLNVRPMALEYGPRADMEDLASHAAARGLATLLTPFAFQPERDPNRGGYSNRMTDIQPLEQATGGWCGVLVSPDPDCVVLGWLCLAAGWDRLLGRLLGYPACCADAFALEWQDAQTHWMGDPATRLLAAPRDPSRPLPWRTNIFARYAAPCLIEHFPCRFDCPATLLIARRVERCLERFRPEILTPARVAMRSLVYEDAQGLVLLPATAWQNGIVSLTQPGPNARLAGLRVAPDGLWRDGRRVEARFAAFIAEETML